MALRHFVVEQLPENVLRRAMLNVCANSSGTDEASRLLEMLGLVEA